MELKVKKNENCLLYKGLNVKLYKRCDYCESRFFECLGTQYNTAIMMTFTLLLILNYLSGYPILYNLGILLIVAILVILGFLVNTKTDELYLNAFDLKKKSMEMEKLNRELRSLNESMHARTEELTRANKELRKLDQMKSDFISMVSHEFRSPLTSIKAFSNILLYNNELVRPEERNDFLKIIDQESDRLTRMVNDILDLSKLEAGKMEWNMQDVSLPDIITKATGSIAPLSNAKEIWMDTEVEKDLPMVMGDADRLMQVITNLLSNAVKFTGQKGNIRIAARSAGNEIQVSVEDDGIGIPEDQRQEIFSKFKQGGNVLTGKPKGTGLGLPICKVIIHAHGGMIWAEGRAAGQESRFVFTVPLARKVLLQESMPSQEEMAG